MPYYSPDDQLKYMDDCLNETKHFLVFQLVINRAFSVYVPWYALLTLFLIKREKIKKNMLIRIKEITEV
jgi:hypothetical protein